MARLALVLEIIFGGALALRSLVHWRRTGTTGYVRATLKPEVAARGLLGVSMLLAAAGPILAITGSVSPMSTLMVLPLQVAGIIVFAVGAVGLLLAQFAMGESWRVGVDPSDHTDLVTNGPFSLVRHPVYSAGILTGIGLALVLPSPLMFGSVIFGVLGIELQVRKVEEPHLVAQHGKSYLIYASRTGRFFPGIGRLGGTAS